MWMSTCPSTSCWKEYSFSIGLSWCPCQKSIDYKCMGLLLGFQFSSIYVYANCSVMCDSFVTPMDRSLPGSSIHGTLQARVLKWFAIPSPGNLPNPGIEPRSPDCRQILSHLSYQRSPHMPIPYHFD